MVAPKLILGQWRLRKLSHDQCVQDLLSARDPSSIRLIEVVETVRRMERERQEAATRDALLGTLEAGLGAFRSHASIEEFQSQFAAAHQERPAWRFKFLLLRGRSRMGKSQKAMSLYGIKGSLLVNCQGLKSDLPSLRSATKGNIKCIVFDEISAEQVLANKLVFQAGPWPVTLGQSACGQHAYALNVYALPMICCSNDFKTTEADGLSKEQAQWLKENMLEASPPSDAPWFWPKPSQDDQPMLPQ